jgi:hypothetical protein
MYSFRSWVDTGCTKDKIGGDHHVLEFLSFFFFSIIFWVIPDTSGYFDVYSACVLHVIYEFCLQIRQPMPPYI